MNPEIIALLAMALSTVSSDAMLQAPKNLEELEIIMQSQQAAEYTVPREVGIEKNMRYIKPVIKAKSAIAIDVESGSILFKQNAFQRLPIASITKLMTALIVIENTDNLDKYIKIPYAAARVGGSSMYLKPNELITVRQALEGLLIPSGNDAATALAMHTSGSVEEFVEQMNQKAKDLGLIDTSFANPMGFDDEDNFSTAYELTILAKEILKHPDILRIVNKPVTTVKSISGKFEHRMFNTNKLLNSYLSIKGLKTGRTEEAGASLVTYADKYGKEIIAVVLNSPDRHQENKALVDWVYQTYTWPTKNDNLK